MATGDICTHCGQPWDDHFYGGVFCPDPSDPGKTTTGQFGSFNGVQKLKVRCIDNDSGNGNYTYITIGQIYEVQRIREKDGWYELVGIGVGGAYWKPSRFMILSPEEEAAMFPTTKPTTAPTSHKVDEVVAFFRSVPSDHCPCNMLRELCSYHRNS
jgi:hypothetical protein